MNFLNESKNSIHFIRAVGAIALIAMSLFWYFGFDNFSEGGKVFYGLITFCALPAALLLVFGREKLAAK